METLTGIELAFIILQMAIAIYGLVGGLVLIVSGFKDGGKKIGALLTTMLGLFLICSGLYATLLFYTNITTLV